MAIKFTSQDIPAKKSTAARKNARVMVQRNCVVCSNLFEAVPNEVKRGKALTCSNSCKAKLASRPDQSGDANPNWKGGVPKTEKNKRYIERYPEKHEAHRLMTNAIRRGDLLRQPCEVCGETKVDGHHADYSKPLDVRWLCRVHHLEAHKGKFGQAGTQALPVDTNPRERDSNVASPVQGERSEVPALHSPKPPLIHKPKIGRPKTDFDRNEYQKLYMRDKAAIKRLGLNCTVKEWREKNDATSV